MEDTDDNLSNSSNTNFQSTAAEQSVFVNSSQVDVNSFSHSEPKTSSGLHGTCSLADTNAQTIASENINGMEFTNSNSAAQTEAFARYHESTVALTARIGVLAARAGVDNPLNQFQMDVETNNIELPCNEDLEKIAHKLSEECGQVYTPRPVSNRLFIKPMNKNAKKPSLAAAEDKTKNGAVMPRIRKRDHSASSILSISSVSTSNRFELLAETNETASSTLINVPKASTSNVRLSDCSDSEPPNTKKQKSATNAKPASIKSTNNNGSTGIGTKRIRIPPIVVNSDNKGLVDVLFSHELKFKPRLLAGCVKIMPDNQEQHKLITIKLKELELPFHSYAFERTKKLKAIAYGVPFTDEPTVLNELKQCGAPVLSVRLIKSVKHTHYQRYFVEFEKNGMNVDVLNNKFQFLLRHKISWSLANNKKAGIMVCRRCAGIGHGISCCHQMITCIYCAGNHFGYDCLNTAIDSETGRRAAAAPKCANCDFAGLPSNHTAIDISCPLALAEKAKIKNGFGKNKKSPTSKNMMNNIHAKDASWPELRRALLSGKSQTLSGTDVKTGSPFGAASSFAEITKSGAPQQMNTRSRSRHRRGQSSMRNRSQSNVTFDDWEGSVSAFSNGKKFAQMLSLEQCVSIATEIANGYEQCHSLNDQIQLILRVINKMKK